jgi:hypothetical protein
MTSRQSNRTCDDERADGTDVDSTAIDWARANLPYGRTTAPEREGRARVSRVREDAAIEKGPLFISDDS